MKAILIVHSQTGHTALFARAIAEQITKAGHEADIHLLRTAGFVKPSTRNITFRKIPDISSYDTVLAGGPVWAFNASPAILAYLNGVESMKGKRAAAFATHGLPFKWAGPNAMISKLSNKLEVLGADVITGESYFWLFGPDKARMETAAARLTQRLCLNNR